MHKLKVFPTKKKSMGVLGWDYDESSKMNSRWNQFAQTMKEGSECKFEPK
jgi:hypothetical protein